MKSLDHILKHVLQHRREGLERRTLHHLELPALQHDVVPVQHVDPFQLQTNTIDVTNSSVEHISGRGIR